MRWFRRKGFLFDGNMKVTYPKDAAALENACEAALSRKRRKNG